MRVVLLVSALLICQAVKAQGPSFWVKSVGDRTQIIHHNDLAGTLDLSSLKDTAHLYGLGPVAGLQGEITIYNSRPSVSTIIDNKPSVNEAFEGEAVFLLFAFAPTWKTINLKQPLHGLSEVEAMVKQQARANGLDITKPFPFRIEGTVEKIVYHIIFKTGDLPHNKHEHHKAKRKYTLEHQPIQIIGFWVDEPRVGKLSHPGKHTHLHMLLPDNSTSGHIDMVHIANAMKLYLPE